jgi:hypothetical protein
MSVRDLALASRHTRPRCLRYGPVHWPERSSAVITTKTITFLPVSLAMSRPGQSGSPPMSPT